MPRKSKNYIDIGWGIKLRTWLILPIIFILLFLDRAAIATQTEAPAAHDLELPYIPEISPYDAAANEKIELIILPLPYHHSAQKKEAKLF